MTTHHTQHLISLWRIWYAMGWHQFHVIHRLETFYWTLWSWPLLLWYCLQGIVSHECLSRKVPLHIATVAHQLFLSGTVGGSLWSSYVMVVVFYCSLILSPKEIICMNCAYYFLVNFHLNINIILCLTSRSSLLVIV